MRTNKELLQNTFERYQRKYLKNILKEIKIELEKKLEKAFVSGAIPTHWKETGNYMCVKAVIDSFCKDRPYSILDKKHQKEAENLHLFL